MNLSQTLTRRWAAACLAVLALTAAPARGASTPRSDFLEEAVDSAELIVLGRLDPDGRLSVREVLEGDAVKEPIRVGSGASIASGLQRTAKVEGAVEVVAFLKKPADGEAMAPRGLMGFAALKGDAVFTVGDRNDTFDESRVQYTRETLLAGIRAALLPKRERTRIGALPRGPERTGAMVAFLRERVASKKAAPPDPPLESIHLRAFALALKNPTPAETSALVAALREEMAPVEKAELVKLAGLIPLGPEGFDAVTPWVAWTVPAVLRRPAMDALARMDQARAVEVLIPFLFLYEPDLINVLGALGSHSYPPSDPWLDLRAVDALERLALEMRKQHAIGGNQVFLNEGYALLHQLAHYSHPRLVRILVEWALAEDHATSAQAFSELRAVTGLTFPETDKGAWRAWWARARPLLEPAYTLTDAPGLEQWLKAWTKADQATRTCLMRLWTYEAQIDWKALLKVAESREPARRILAELWRCDHLPAEAKQAIVEQFLSVKLVEKSAYPGRPDIREVAVELESAFPFPATSWVHCASNITIGDREPVLKDGESSSIFCLRDFKTVTSASTGGGSYPGQPTARAIYELREEDRTGRNHGWKMRWTLEPLELRDSRKK